MDDGSESPPAEYIEKYTDHWNTFDIALHIGLNHPPVEDNEARYHVIQAHYLSAHEIYRRICHFIEQDAGIQGLVKRHKLAVSDPEISLRTRTKPE